MNEQSDNVSSDPAEARGISGVLGDPEGYIRHLCKASRLAPQAAFLILLALGGAALYGFGAGFFVDWKVALLDAMKAGGVVLFGYLLCLPTLYVFASIAGSKVDFKRTALIGLVVLASTGCLLAALAPVLWLFAVSTAAKGFFVLFSFVLIGIAVALGARTLNSAAKAGAVKGAGGLAAWFAIFLVVVLQAVTLACPMLEPVGTDAHRDEKRFFLTHFLKSVIDPSAR